MKNNKETIEKEILEKAYLYLVKMPSSNDIIVCAYKNKLKRNDSVILRTRYGEDLGEVLGFAKSMLENTNPSGDNPRYQRGCAQVCGACGYSPVNSKNSFGGCTLKEFPHFKFTSDVGTPFFENQEEKEPLDVIRHNTNQIIESSDVSAASEDIQLGIPKENEDSDMVLVGSDVEYIERLATMEEIERYRQNQENEKKAADICKEKIAKHGLNMKLVNVHFLLLEQKALFFFTSEDRVDFRELVKDLVSVFKMRIELRQIGVRDESRVLGGLAVCGRDFCCHCVSDKLSPVSIKMAKDQDLSLNSTKISGPCGRLLCCLNYEYNFYTEEKASYPSEGTRIKIGSELYRVVENNILTKKTKLSSTEGGELLINRTDLVFNAEQSRWSVSARFLKEFLNA